MVVRWETDRNARPWLRVLSSPLTSPQIFRWFTGNTDCPDGNKMRCISTVFVTGLSPDHSSIFVLGDVEPLTKTGVRPNGQFTTEPINLGSEEFSFSVFGDVQGEGGKAWNLVSKTTVDLQGATGRAGGPVLHTGDLNLTLLEDDIFFTSTKSMLSRHPFFPAHGNGDDELQYLRYFGSTGRLNPLNYDNNTQTFYSLNYANTHFIFLDTLSLDSCAYKQANWLRNNLSNDGALNADNIVLVAHHGPFGRGKYVENSILQTCLSSLFTDLHGKPTNFFRKLRLVLSGHQHSYQRIKKIHQVGTEMRGVYYLTVGTAGATPACPVPVAGLRVSSASICNNPPAAATYDYQGINVEVRGGVFEIRAYNYAFDAAGHPVPVGVPAKSYSLLDCFAFDNKGTSVSPENAYKL
ncbi:MAG: metallophosphoesterase [Cyanobacteriota bacterium]|nr:metallophosphoesterase [Cyanobacteriota bacterium]